MSGQSPEIRHDDTVLHFFLLVFHIDISCYISGTTVTLQFREDFVTDKCTIELFGKEQVDMFMMKIPSIEKPEPEVQTTVV
jgi:hypothetical protein